MGLTTHVLDTSRGRPADAVAIDLHAVRGAERVALASTVTNADGRTDTPLAASLERGIYEITFHVADYFRRTAATSDDPPFLDVVVIRIGIARPGERYHVPLLVSPYGYSTYRGS
jgi:5-hydroxyisourate hydrolase